MDMLKILDTLEACESEIERLERYRLRIVDRVRKIRASRINTPNNSYTPTPNERALLEAHHDVLEDLKRVRDMYSRLQAR